MNYELLYIVPAKFSDTEVEKINQDIVSLVEKKANKIIKIDYWGKRKLAYQIRQFRYGYYTLIIFSAPPQAIQELSQKLNMDSRLIRFQIVKEVKTNPQQTNKITKPQEKEEKKSVLKEKKKEEKTHSKEEKKDSLEEKKKREDNKEKEEKEKKDKKETKKKVSIDELDKKLDELLEDAL